MSSTNSQQPWSRVLSHPSAARALWLMLFVMTAITGALALRLQIDGDVAGLIDSRSEQGQRYRDFRRRFPHEEREWILLLEGPIFSADGLTLLSELHATLQQDAAVQVVRSLWSLPAIQQLNARPGDTQAEQLQVLHDVRQQPGSGVGHALSADGRLMVVSVLLQPGVLNDARSLDTSLERLRESLNPLLAGAGFRCHGAGFPELRLQLNRQIQADFLRFALLGLLFSTVASVLLFHRWRTIVLALAGPVIGVVWTLGALSLLNVPLNLLTQLVAVLLLAIAFADSMHLHHALAERSNPAIHPAEAVLQVLSRTGPACLLSMLTTAVGLLTLVFADATALRQFGWVSTVGSLLVFVAVILNFVAGALRWTPAIEAGTRLHPATDTSVSFTPASLNRDRRISAIAVLVLITTAAIGALLQPGFDLTESLPPDHALHQTLDLADAQLSGILPVQVLVTTEPSGRSAAARQLRQIRAVSRFLEQHTGRQWTSVNDALNLLPGLVARFRLEMLPADVRERLIDSRDGQALISTQVTQSDLSGVSPVIASLQRLLMSEALTKVAVHAEVAGFTAAARDAVQHMIGDLARSVFGAILLITLLMYWYLRNGWLAFAALVPNVLPLTVAAAVLVLIDEPLRYPTVLVFCLGLGLSVNNAIHLLIRWRHHVAANVPPVYAIGRARRELSRIMLATTAIINAGFLALTISETPAIATMGWLSVGISTSALTLNLLLLPALVRLALVHRISGSGDSRPR